MKTIKTQMKRIAVVLLSGIFLIAVASCSGNKKSQPVNSDQTTLDKKEIEKTVREVVYPLPTAFEVTEMINKIEASYILGLSNLTANTDKYFTDKAQALNLGVYSADLSYASTYNMQQEIMSYLEASENLIVELGITGAFSKTFISDIETSINDKSKLTKLITNSFYDAYEYLVKSDKQDLSLLVLTGSWIEGMYISCNISETVYHNPELVKIILHQKNSLNKLIELLNTDTQHETIKEILVQLKPIKQVYESIDEQGITESQLNDIIKKVENLRAKIIS